MPTPEVPLINERPDEFKVPENLAKEIETVATSPQTTIQVNGQNQPVISSGNQSVKIQLPGDRVALVEKAKGSINNAATWFYRFLLRLWDKQKYANSTTTNQ